MTSTSTPSKRIVVTGGAGFLGSHLVDALLARGDSVVAVDNFCTGRRQNVAHLEGNDRFELVELDVSAGMPIAGRVDAVCHLASPASPPAYIELGLATLAVGSEGTRHCLDLAKSNDATFLLASTSEVYGDPQVHPQPESYWGNVNSIGPRSVYDEAKRFAEALTMAHHRSLGTDTRIVRIFNTYGPRMRIDDGRVVTNFVSQALRGEPLTVYGSGNQTRSFCYVDDEVAGLIALLDSDIHEPINIGNPGEFTMIELAELVTELVPTAAGIEYRELPPDDPTRRQPDITLATQRLGWTPTVSLREGLEATIAHVASELGL